jgi:hypothetical protein
MSRIFYLFLVLILISCTSPGKTLPEKEQKFTVPNIKSDKLSKKSSSHSIITKEQLMGIWAGENSENASFSIGKDSIYYPDQMDSYPYTLIKDSLTIIYPDMSFEGIAYLAGDTLVLSDPEFGISRYTRLKN